MVSELEVSKLWPLEQQRLSYNVYINTMQLIAFLVYQLGEPYRDSYLLAANSKMEEMPGAVGIPQENAELWVQLGAETRSTNLAILQNIQELKSEMARLREDNARLTVEQERILKSLSGKQNPPLANPSAEQQRTTEEQDYAPEISEKEDHSDNVLEKQTSKRQKMELQGEFRKIKPPHFDGEQEEAAEAWLININKYFQLYEYDQNLKARLAIFQLQGKATLWWEEIKIVKGVSEQSITWEKFQK